MLQWPELKFPPINLWVLAHLQCSSVEEVKRVQREKTNWINVSDAISRIVKDR